MSSNSSSFSLSPSPLIRPSDAASIKAHPTFLHSNHDHDLVVPASRSPPRRMIEVLSDIGFVPYNQRLTHTMTGYIAMAAVGIRSGAATSKKLYFPNDAPEVYSARQGCKKRPVVNLELIRSFDTAKTTTSTSVVKRALLSLPVYPLAMDRC
ncbi:hypothetical protein BDW60DRAFT_192127 [Aspergillus nidulans var. acristatus]